MNNLLTFTNTHLVVEPRGLDKLWSFTTTLKFPWEHVRGATHDPGMKQESKGWRGPGLHLGQKFSGTFHRDHEKQFWNVSGFENAVLIELSNERYSQLVLSLDNPNNQVAEINRRAKGQ